MSAAADQPNLLPSSATSDKDGQSKPADNPAEVTHKPAEAPAVDGTRASTETEAAKVEERKTDRRLKRVAETITSVRGIVTNALVLLAVLLIIVVIAAEAWHQSIVLDPIGVPKDLADNGWSPDGVALRINDKIKAIQEKGKLRYSSEEIGTKHQIIKEDREQVDVQVPGSGLSIRSTVRYAKQWLGFSDTHIGGNITHEGDTLQLVLRSSNSSTPVGIPREQKVEDLLDRAAEAIVRMESPHLLAWYFYGQESDSGDFKKTEEEVKYCLAQKQEEVVLWANLVSGLILAHGGQYDDAIKKYELIVATRPNFALAYGYWGNALNRLKKYDEAITKYQKAFELDPRDASTLTDWGNTLQWAQRYEEAIGRYQKAIELAPNEPVLYSNWCNSLNDLGRPNEAIPKCEQALEIDPNYAMATHNLGVAFERLGRYEEALEKYKKANALNPNQSESCKGWSNMLRQLRRDETTDAEYQKACGSKPS